MATTAQSTTALRPARAPRTVAALDGTLIPAHVNQQTDMGWLPTAASVYLRLNDGKVAVDTMIAVMDAMRDSSAVVTLYTDGKCETQARVIWPESVTLTSDNAITCYGYCTLRRQFRSFRLDRMVTCHALTTPDDAEFTPDTNAAPAAPAPYYSTQVGMFAHMQAQEVARAAKEGRMPRAMND